MSEVYKPNSHKARAEEAAEKKIEKVVTGPVKVKKKGEMHKLADVFIAEDASRVKSYIFADVLVPAIKKLVYDVFTNGIDMILYGGRGGGDKKPGSPYVSYNRYSDRAHDSGRNYEANKVKYSYSPNDITVNSRGEAEYVISEMMAIIKRYGFVTVADLYDLVGVAANYTDQKYGWTNVDSAEPIRVRDGYMLKLPKALPIDD